ncbi:hypothetical protein [Xylophilus sp. ASV27]|uniref:hypothetical protein n=1 Tax=Xylophilus sp. ASV27 TaxID=2795129 RepID=UPI0018EC51D7|nr:hypothetical protein [Xylophilus sp. ASV27]
MHRLRLIGIALAATSAALLSGCVVAPVSPYYGAYYQPAPVVVSPSIGFYGSYGYGYRRWR